MISIMKEAIKSCAVELFGSKFNFRKGQLEAIESIIVNVNSTVKQTVLEAPTGSGKSVIGIVTAYALWKLYEKKSYILTSDLSLFAQYENDIHNLNVNCFGCIKGKDNYVCADNGCKVSQATCALHGLSVISLLNNPKYSRRFTCVKNCQYIRDYAKAVFSPITLMTYQMYFIQRNYVEDAVMFGQNKNFPARDLVIADECHNLCSICQSHFAPVISISKPYWMSVLESYYGMPNRDYMRSKIVSSMIDSADGKALAEGLCEYEKLIVEYAKVNQVIRESLKVRNRRLTKRDKSALAAGNRARQECCKVSDMLSFAATPDEVGNLTKTAAQNSLTVNYVFDSVMLNKFFHHKSKCELLMSATIGDFDEYAKLAGLEKSFKSISMHSTFNFSRSPIYVSYSNKMSYTEKDKSLMKIVAEVDEISKLNVGTKGIIQTGSYANSELLRKSLSPDVAKRCLFYRNTQEKNEALRFFTDPERSNDSILVGPTLLEGLNFPDGMCRFQICVKVPYAHLGSEYVRKKKDLVDGWYKYDVLNKLCQGIGRGVRHEHDWCKTYILDGCIQYLMEDLKKFNVLAGRFGYIED